MEQDKDIQQLMQHLEEQLQRDPRVLAPLIMVYERILEQLQPEKNPYDYASTQAKLGLAYSHLQTGNRAVNLGKAIICYRKALSFWTPENAPHEYAALQDSLGHAYAEIPMGNLADNLTQAILYFQEALHFWTPETTPIQYASTQSNLGRAYSELPTGDRTANLTQAIACYQQALRILTPETAPFEYAITQINLGTAYAQMPTGDRTTNLTKAITYFKEALRFFTPEAVPSEYAAIQGYLGNSYSEMPTGNRTDNQAQAISHFQEALRFLTEETAPFKYAMLQSNLGNVYRQMLAGDRSTNLIQAIACYQQALRFLTEETAPSHYAIIQLNLGTAYSDLPTGDRAKNLTQAITCYRQALRFLTEETSPSNYADILHNIGVAYSHLTTGDRAANIIQAIACYQEALRFRTPETAPFEYASTQTNLGVAYYELPTGDRAANLTNAIICYEQALRFQTPETAPLDYANILNNLGLAYIDLPTGDRAANLTQAITYFKEALRFETPETTPFKYASTQNNLGSAYRQLPTGDRAVNLARAISCYQEALRFRTLETAPFDYALTQNNLGVAYRELPTGDRAANLAQAISCYQEALRVWTPEIAPSQCRIVSRNLANLLFAEGKWNVALSTYRAAMDAGERLYRAGLSTESKITEVAENVAFYRHAAFSAVRSGETAEALLILERGKTRLLTEALRLRIPRPINVPDEVWSALEHAGAAVRAAQSGNTAMSIAELDPVQTYADRVQAAQSADLALQAAIEHIRVHAPDFLREIDLPTVQALLPDASTVFVAFCITYQGSVGFVVSRYDQDVQIVELPTFTQRELSNLFVELDADGRAISGWLVAYARNMSERTSTAPDAWQAMITDTLVKLGQRLLDPIVSILPSNVNRIIFLPSAESFLVPLHAAPLSDKGTDLVCDHYQVSYVPSIEVLANIQTKAVRVAVPELYAVVNPQDDPRLIFTPTEGIAIARFFAQTKVDEGRFGTKQRVIAGSEGRTYVHFSCHGSYDWNDPIASGLDLADGRLTLADLQRGEIDLSAARLVTLSACETGITDVTRGPAEEYVGIPAGFLLAGVPCVVSSLWTVPDLSTALLMERFYRNHLKDGMDIAAALREAQVWVRQLVIGEVAQYADQWYRQAQGEEKAELFGYMRYYRAQTEQNPALRPFAHPYYWAAFTVNGL